MSRFAPVALMIVVCIAGESRADHRFEQIFHGLAHASGAHQAYDHATGNHASEEQVIMDEEMTPAATTSWTSSHNSGHASYGSITSSCRSCGNPWAGYCCEKRHKKCRQPKCWKPLWGCSKKSCCSATPACGCDAPAPACGCQKSVSCGCHRCRKPLFAGCKKWFRSLCDSCQQSDCGCDAGAPMMEEVPADELEEPTPPMAPPMPEEEQTTQRKLPLRMPLFAGWATL